MQNAVTEMLGIDFPILAFSHCRDVVVAVSKAGGLGVLGAITYTPEALETELRWIEDALGEQPYGVDVLLPAVEAAAPGASAPLSELIPDSHVEFVLGLLRAHGVTATRAELWGDSGLAGEGLGLWSQRSSSLLDVAFDHDIALVASALGPPSEQLIEGARARGIATAALAGKVEHARRHAALGVDLIVAQGTEAGGHTGEIATMVLVPEIVDAVDPVPVVAAGGIGRGRQVAAAFALGAQGVWCGSVWLTTEEAETDPVVKEKFLAATSADTVRSRSRTGKPARQLRSAWTDAWEEADAPPPLPSPFQNVLAEPALRRVAAAAVQPGGPGRELASYYVGQIVGSMNRPTSTRQVVFDMIDEFIETLQGLQALTES